MPRAWFACFMFCLVFFGQSVLFFALPGLGAGVFLSPDETAVATSARAFGMTGSMRIEDKILTDGPWLHPRSYVTQGSAMVPVGFLGLPTILGAVWKILGEWGLSLFVPLLVISTAFPLWKFASRFGRFASAMAVIVWMSYPSVILYANRGLFPNLAALCFAVWGLYFLSVRRSERWLIGAGLCLGMAATIRPTELVWIIPWVWFVCREYPIKRTDRTMRWIAGGLLALAFPCLLVMLVAWRTYGSPFLIGYFLHDPIVQAAGSSVSNVSVRLLPFGLHPRDVWFNFQSYILGFLGPWFALMLFACAVYIRNKKSLRFILVSLWTVLSLAVLYGEGIYQDHVGVNVISSGNSYLRYMVPLASLVAISSAALIAWTERRWGKNRSRLLGAFVACLLVWLGTWTAMSRDDEGILVTRNELQRYAELRTATLENLGPKVIIVSDRSDKIFFPTFRVATPIPPFDELRPLVANAPVPTLLFATTLDAARTATWRQNGIILRPVLNSHNETLYEMYPSTTTTSP